MVMEDGRVRVWFSSSDATDYLQIPMSYSCLWNYRFLRAHKDGIYDTCWIVVYGDYQCKSHSSQQQIACTFCLVLLSEFQKEKIQPRLMHLISMTNMITMELCLMFVLVSFPSNLHWFRQWSEISDRRFTVMKFEFDFVLSHRSTHVLISALH